MEKNCEAKCFKKENGISWKFVENDAKIVILNLKDGSFYSLEDETSIFIWQNLMNGDSFNELRRETEERYPNKDREEIESDLSSFVATAIKNKIIYPYFLPTT